MNALASIWLLVWKNFKLKLRHRLVTIMELVMPCLFTIILVIVRIIIKFEKVNHPTIYEPFPIVNRAAFNERVVLFTPNTTEYSRIIDTFVSITNDSTLSVKGFADESALVDHYIDENGKSILGGVIFQQFKQNNVQFKLRFPFVPPKDSMKFDFQNVNQFTWLTSRRFPQFHEPGPRNKLIAEGGPPNYDKSGFLYLQHHLTLAFAHALAPNSAPFLNSIRINLQRFPYPSYVDDKFLFSLQFMFPLILMLSFIYPAVNLTKNIVLEKELRLQEAMRMMGLQDWLHWTSWFVNSFIWIFLSVAMITLLLCVPLPVQDHVSIITKSNPVIILLFFIVYLITTISFCFMMSTFFNRANLAGVLFSTVYFATFLPYFYVSQNYHDLSQGAKLGLGLISNTNMAIGCMLISMWESEHVGLQWSNMFEVASPDDNTTFGWILVQFCVSSVLYFMVAFYVSNVFPGEFGFAKKWNFMFQSSYWSKSSYIYTASKLNQSRDEESQERKRGTCIRNVCKTYNKGRTFALSDLNLNLEDDEITVLLGHNGSGKTTLMSILCGLIPPTSGEIFINQHNLMTDLHRIRKSLGICPQFDVLFDYLTVEEHLWFYCKLKQVDSKKIKDEIDQMIKLLDLKNKRHSQTHTLSGGMKRKLSIGIALIGGSKFVLLDECTSGMDVSARRFVWDLLLKEKRKRTILLSTHFMEEADVLGDKIAILDGGQLKAFGSPMNLKKTYGEGYFFRLSVKDAVNFKLLGDLVRSYIIGAKLITSVAAEIIWSLPESESSKFEILFKTIEQNMDELGVLDYSISVTTIEEVFLKVGDFSRKGVDHFNNLDADAITVGGKGDEESIMERMQPDSLVLNTGLTHTFQIYSSLILKKLLFIVRNKFLLISQFPLPAFLLWISILTNRNQMNRAIDSPSLKLSFESFQTAHTSLFHFGNPHEQQLSELYKTNFRQLHSVDVKEYILKRNETEMLNHLVETGEKDEAEYNLFYLTATMLHWLEDHLEIRILFNNQAYHTSAISVSNVDQVLLRAVTRDSDFSLAVYNEPLPRINADAGRAREFDAALQVSLSNNVQFSICFLMASFVILLVKERVTNFRHIQLISGLKLWQYWISNFVLDYVSYLVSSVLMCLVIYVSNVEALASWENQMYLLFSFAMHGLASLPFNYILSKCFSDPATAYVRVALYTIIVGTTTFLVVLILEFPEFDIQEYSSKLHSVFLYIVPVYTMSMSIYSLYQNSVSRQFCMADVDMGNNQTMNVQELCKYIISAEDGNIFAACCKNVCGTHCFPFTDHILSWEKPGLGQLLLGFACQAIFYWLFLSWLECDRFFQLRWFARSINQEDKPQTHIEGDDDVKAEELRIKQRNYFTLNKSDSMVVQNVTKKYGDFVAVDNISFGVKRSECFGVLGVNGSGKTTTFKMITGDESITRGDIRVNGISVRKHRSQVYQHIGYCPQFDGLLDQLTGRETLRIISRIRGIEESLIDKQIEALSKLLYFEQHINKRVLTYSGGTKRKLSFCISILGNPMITFLDEPTTGVDPVSRRCLWRAIQLARSCGTSIVFTSHSMEECEVLCNRLTIMVNSRLACLGSPLHLKQKYSAGYIVHIKLRAPELVGVQAESRKKLLLAEFTQLNKFMTTKLCECRLETIHNNLMTYRVGTGQAKLSKLFGEIERVKEELGIEDYSIYQTSLERIFLSFAQQASK